MSRIGKQPITLPAGLEINVADGTITVKGPKGTLSQSIPSGIYFEQEGSTLLVKRESDSKQHSALHGLMRALTFNMVHGVSVGFEKKMEMVGVGYRAQMQGDKLVLNVGYSHPVEFIPPEGISFEVAAPTKFSIKGIDKELVGNIAADIRAVRPPEPYKGKGIKYENEVIRRKAGKAGAK